MIRLREILLFGLVLLCAPVVARAEMLAQVAHSPISVGVFKKDVGYAVILHYETQENAPDIDVFAVENPLRLVLDISSVSTKDPYERLINDAIVSKLRIGVHEEKIRIVIDLEHTALPSYSVSELAKENAIYVRFHFGDKPEKTNVSPPAGPAPQPTLPVTAETQPPTSSPTPSSTEPQLTGIAYKVLPDTKEQVLELSLSESRSYLLSKVKDGEFHIALEETSLASQQLTVPKFAPDTFSHFQMVNTKIDGTKTIVRIYTPASVSLQLSRSGNTLVVRTSE